MTTSYETAARPALRLTLSAFPPGSGMLDGAWWPRTREIDTEVAHLVDLFPPSVGRIGRVLFSRPDWSTHPHHIRAARGFVKTGSFPSDDTHVVLLKLSSGTQLKVLVVPPDSTAQDADRLMASAVAEGNRSSGPELLVAVAGREPEASGARWNDDGGVS
ncbi:DUF5994 family protein [Nocardioides maradonensis]